MLNIAICPGCGGRMNKRSYECRSCGYEWPDAHPLTIQEMLEGKILPGHYNSVALEAYTCAVVEAVSLPHNVSTLQAQLEETRASLAAERRARELKEDLLNRIAAACAQGPHGFADRYLELMREWAAGDKSGG